MLLMGANSPGMPILGLGLVLQSSSAIISRIVACEGIRGMSEFSRHTSTPGPFHEIINDQASLLVDIWILGHYHAL